MFKIRNKDGLFSSGGTWPSWTKVGKVWRLHSHLSGHLAQLTPKPNQYLGPREEFYTDSDEVVEFEMVEVGAVSLSDYDAARIERGRDRNERKKQGQLNMQRDHLERELARIASELGSLKRK